MVPSGNLVGIAAFAALLACAGARCPGGYAPWFDGYCFRVITFVDFPDAKKACEQDGAELASIHSAQENAWMAKLMGPASAWIGLQCDKTGQRAHWLDGTPTDFIGPAGEVTNCDSSMQYAMDSTGRWITNMKFLFMNAVCRAKKRSSIHCDDFDDVPGSTECMRFYSGNHSTWNDAEKTCKGINAHLVSIHDAVTNDWIADRTADLFIDDGIHIGLSSYVSTNKLRWTDGSDVTFTEYDPGFPKDSFGHCTMLETGSGAWRTIQCASTKLPYICGRPGTNIGPTQAPPSCPQNKYFNGSGEVYSPSYPNGYPTRLSCEYILTVPQGQKVELTLVDFETSACCDTLAVYEGVTGNFLRYTFSGISPNGGSPITTINSNSMRLVWTPGNAVGVRGWHAAFRGIAWP